MCLFRVFPNLPTKCNITTDAKCIGQTGCTTFRNAELETYEYAAQASIHVIDFENQIHCKIKKIASLKWQLYTYFEIIIKKEFSSNILHHLKTIKLSIIIPCLFHKSIHLRWGHESLEFINFLRGIYFRTHSLLHTSSNVNDYSDESVRKPAT